MGSTERERTKNPLRYSDKEKKILYNLFKKYESIIDIKQRKNTSHKLTEVRECWQTILNSFNSYSCTTARNLKQLQKFWLNSRLRTRNSSCDSMKVHNSSSRAHNRNNRHSNNSIKEDDSKLISVTDGSLQSPSDNFESESEEEEEEEYNHDQGKPQSFL